MEKIVNPCKCKVYDIRGEIREVPAFVKIEYKEKKPGQKVLSITGVVGPMRNGDCHGSCGQCIDEISGGIPADGWDVDMIKKLCKIWRRWHLNDMNAACEHQRAVSLQSIFGGFIPFFIAIFFENACKIYLNMLL